MPCSFPPERLSQLLQLKMSSVPVTLPPPPTYPQSILSQLLQQLCECMAGPRFKYRCHGVEPCCLPLQHICDFLKCILCAYVHVCQPPDTSAGIKDALSPLEEAAGSHPPDTSVTDPPFYCSYISLYPPHLPLYFIILF